MEQRFSRLLRKRVQKLGPALIHGVPVAGCATPGDLTSASPPATGDGAVWRSRRPGSFKVTERMIAGRIMSPSQSGHGSGDATIRGSRLLDSEQVPSNWRASRSLAALSPCPRPRGRVTPIFLDNSLAYFGIGRYQKQGARIS